MHTTGNANLNHIDPCESLQIEDEDLTTIQCGPLLNLLPFLNSCPQQKFFDLQMWKLIAVQRVKKCRRTDWGGIKLGTLQTLPTERDVSA